MASNSRGFTLLELIAALAIFAMMSVMAYGGLDAVIRTRRGLDDTFARMETWQRGVHRLREDIEQVRDRSILDEFGDRQPAFIQPGDTRIEFTRGGRPNPLLAARSSLERVAYSLENDKLVRYAWRTLDRSQSDEPVKLAVLDGIRTATWRYLDDDAEWQDIWPPLDQQDAMALLPVAVELRMDTKAFDDVTLRFFVRAPE